MKNLYYYRLEDAEEIRRSFASWIGKKAHIGKGQVETLKTIIIKQKRQISSAVASIKFYRVEFVFENRKRLSAQEFLYHNSVTATPYHPLIVKSRDVKAA
jgi:hypothetical protein